PPPGSVIIRGASTSGSGCPQGTVDTTISQTSDWVTFGFDSFRTAIGPDASTQAIRSQYCSMRLDMLYPGGYQYSIIDATYHIYARLDDGVSGAFISTYFFSQNAARSFDTIATFNGPTPPFGTTFTKVDTADNPSIVWSPCGAEGTLNINNRMAMTAANDTLTGEMGDIDATIKSTQIMAMRFAWRTCT
ncbi:hypothetical protein NA57DRAFT_25478, partial [Rhizodiscina lignyota]